MDPKHKEILTNVIKSNFIMTLGTVSNNKPHLCTVFYVTDDNKTLYFKSRTQSEHSKAFANNPNAAGAIYVPNSTYAGIKSGTQTQGKVERVTDVKEMTKAVKLYTKAFAGAEKKFETIPNLVSEFVKSTMYKYTILEAKVLDSSQKIHVNEYEHL